MFVFGKFVLVYSAHGNTYQYNSLVVLSKDNTAYRHTNMLLQCKHANSTNDLFML